MDHHALLYREPDEASALLARWVRDGIREGARVAVVVSEPIQRAVVDQLGARAAQATFVPRERWYTAPAEALDMFARFVRRQGSRPAWTAGEPIWQSHLPFAVRGWARYETVLNHHFAAEDVRSLCVFDEKALGTELQGHVRATHPAISGEHPPNGEYMEPARCCDALSAASESPPGPPAFQISPARGLRHFRHELAAYLDVFGLDAKKSEATVLAVHELVANALEHGGGEAEVRGWRMPDAVVIEVEDDGPGGIDRYAGDAAPSSIGLRGRGVFLARRLSDFLEFPPVERGTVARLYAMG